MELVVPAEIAELAARVDGVARRRGLRVLAVGGTVRDVLLARQPLDFDVVADGDALGLARALADELGGHFVMLDAERGVARVVFDAASVRYVDVAGMQGTLEQDLRRRDFTVNALAAPLTGGTVIDVCGGLDDLRECCLRLVSVQALGDDPLRMMRAVRIACELGFTIEAATAQAMRERAASLRSVAGERRRDELARMLALPDTHSALRQMDELGVLDVLLPEVTFGRGVSQPQQWHVFDVFEHNMGAVAALDAIVTPGDRGMFPQWLGGDVWSAFAWCADELRAYLAEEMSEGRKRVSLLKLAALLHDVAKPQTRSVDDDGRVRFLGHAEGGATVARRIMRRLRFSARETRYVAVLVAEHLRPVQLAAVGESPTRRAAYRMCRDLGDALPGVLLLALADAAAARGPALTRAGWTRQVAYMNSLLVRSVEEEGIVGAPRLLTGRDIMAALRLPEGPLIGRLLESLREAQATGEVSDRAGALAFVRTQASGAAVATDAEEDGETA